jgi:hypothetical protein
MAYCSDSLDDKAGKMLGGTGTKNRQAGTTPPVFGFLPRPSWFCVRPAADRRRRSAASELLRLRSACQEWYQNYRGRVGGGGFRSVGWLPTSASRETVVDNVTHGQGHTVLFLLRDIGTCARSLLR